MNKKFLKIAVLIFVVLAISPVLFLTKPKQKEEVKGISTDHAYHALQLPNDPSYSLQWNLAKTSTDKAWDITTGTNGVTIAVLDTGILSTHKDLSGKIVPGYDFIDNDNDANPSQGGGSAVFHGTFVAGIVAASTNNNYLMAGSCWNCKIMPIRVLDNNGIGTTDVIAEGIRYAADHGAKVINMSFGYAHSDGPDPGLEDAVNYAYNKGVVLVAAAGNDGAGVNYPAAYENVISVGALDKYDTRPSWSSYGPELKVMAPGVSVPSVYTYWNGNKYADDAFGNASGTSFAAPNVAGAAALLMSRDDLSSAYIYKKIETTGDKLGGMNGSQFTEQYGYGRVNAYQLLTNNVSLSSSLTLSNYNAAIGENVTDSFTLKNNLPESVTLDRLLITGRDPNGTPVDYPVHYNVTLAKAGDEGDSITISDQRSFTKPGLHAVWVSYLYGGNWYEAKPDPGQTNYMTFNVHKPDLIVTGVSFNPTVPLIGQDTTVNFSVKNREVHDVKVDVVGIGNHLYSMTGPNYDYGGYTDVTIAAGQTVTYTVKRRLDNPGLYVTVACVKTGDVWSNLAWSNGVSSMSFYTLKVPSLSVTGFYFIPQVQTRTQPVTVSYTVKNNEATDVKLDVLGAGNHLYSMTGPQRDYGGYNDVIIPAGKTVNLTSTRQLTEPGLYVAVICVKSGNYWGELSWGNGVSSRSYYWIN